MNEVYEETEASNESFSAFWPLLVLIVGLLLWSGYQVYVAFEESSGFSRELASAQPAINNAQRSKAVLFSLFQDLVQTAQKNSNAAQIVRASGMTLKAPPSSDTSDTSDTSTTGSSNP